MTIGVHPYHAQEPQDEGPAYLEKIFDRVADLTRQSPGMVTAFGELGLDYDHLEKASKEVQIRTFKTQLDLVVSRNVDLPLFLHCRAAFEDFVQVLSPYLSKLPRRGLVHSFVGSKAQMQTLVGLGLDISVNGFSFRDRGSIEMVSAIPLDNLQIETDAPWGEISKKSEVAKRYLAHAPTLPPSKKKDKFQPGCMVKDRNESCTIAQVAIVVAGLKGITVEEVADAAWKNSTKMFRMV